ncbi:MAG: MazG family protein [Deltaproteobacteria bacterium]|jgi:tetrapyrrole methylase family protein/MazG family protein|nr:MazG family protein [Deltaproteobacteria bacterium]
MPKIRNAKNKMIGTQMNADFQDSIKPKKTKQKQASVAKGRGKNGKKKYALDDLLKIMAKLRSPSGCPWDREQTENSLKKYLIEESYEVLEAIESGTPRELREELADLLLQIVFLSRIAEEKGEFNFLGLVQELAEKLIRRHPHVFPSPDRPRPNPKSAGEVLKIWGSVKELEGKYAKRKSLLDGIPLALPALERARRMSERASRVGFDWPNLAAVWEKVEEELRELKNAEKSPSPRASEELGDLLFTLVNWGRLKGISAEEALRKANRRFARRFFQVEKGLRKRGKRPQDSNLEEMDELWKEAKKERGQ